jgi:hypothetical protein
MVAAGCYLVTTELRLQSWVEYFSVTSLPNVINMCSARAEVALLTQTGPIPVLVRASGADAAVVYESRCGYETAILSLFVRRAFRSHHAWLA